MADENKPQEGDAPKDDAPKDDAAQPNDPNSIFNSLAVERAANEGLPLSEEEQKRRDEEAKRAAEDEQRAREELQKQTENAQTTIIESAESYKAKMYALAMADAAERKLDETVEGGLYKDAYGRWITATGRVVEKVSGADKVKHSGELRAKAKVA